jgi:protein-tyrosine phosphatase
MTNSQTGASRQPNPALIFDGGAQLPVQFRDTASIYVKGAVSLENISALNISGSCQYSEAQLENVVKRIGSTGSFTVYLVDLRQESHVFINGIPVSWYAAYDWANVGRSLEWIENDDTLHLIRMVAARSIIVSTLVKGKDGQFSTKDPVTVEVQDATTEMGLAHQFGVDYMRIPVSDHCRPTDDMVDRFVTFVRELEANAWLHFHCHGGDGRTTTFMTLYDMIRNAGNLALEDIAGRQSLIGEYDLFKGSSEVYKLRTEFINAFYAYVKDGGYASTSWTEWVKTHPLTQAATGSA